jgi:hypothetical protein
MAHPWRALPVASYGSDRAMRHAIRFNLDGIEARHEAAQDILVELFTFRPT